MCYQGNLDWVQACLTPDYVKGKRVLDVGALDVNGSCRTVVEPMGPEIYYGVDTVPGPSVDAVIDFSDFIFAPATFTPPYDIVICLNTLEHCKNWRGMVRNLKISVKPGGLLLFTVPDARFHYHNPPDYWRFEKPQVEAMFADQKILQCFTDVIACTNLAAEGTGQATVDLSVIEPSEVRKP